VITSRRLAPDTAQTLKVAMVLIEAILKPFKLDDVREAIEELGVGGMTVTEVLQTAPPTHRGRSFSTPRPTGDMVPKIRVHVAAPAALAERVIEAICLHGSTGKNEDGLIVVETIHCAVRIRTGDADEDALSS
jgi:nitrogen regulatory protein PII